MKQNRTLFFCLVLIGLSVFVPLAAQTVSLTNFDSFMLDSFDDAENQEWVWSARASRFVTADYPQIKYFEGSPSALRLTLGKSGVTPKVIGLEVRFDRKGDNWLEIFPAKQNADGALEPFEFPLIGQVQELDLWVWGMGYNYDLQAMIRDATANVRVFPIAKLNYNGWRHYNIKIPATVLQQAHVSTGRKNMSFVGFRITTAASAPVDSFVIYFDQFKYLTNTFLNYYDGYELTETGFGSEEEAAE